MSKSTARIATVRLPTFGKSSASPALPAELYQTRLDCTLEQLAKNELDVLLVYADREHSANLAYLTGFDPRFEEALLLISNRGDRKLLVGNECMGYLPDAASLRLEIELFQEFSLMGQPRAESRPLRKILSDFGVRTGSRVGCVGWKHFEGGVLEGGEHVLDIPAYLADLVRSLTGDSRVVVNATSIFTHWQDGLRLINEPAQIAQFEYASCVTSEGVREMLTRLEPGVTEFALERYLDARGLPLSCHRMISFGEKAKRGLSSPSDGRATVGEPFTVGFGVQGALTCRAGMIAQSSKDLPEHLRDFYPRFVENYFQVVVGWYESLRVGVKAGVVVQAVERIRDKKLFKFAVNPGHYLHLDEWVHSPFTAGSPVALRSGMMLQMDVIPVSVGPFCYANAEDGVVLADATLRAELASQFAPVWRRIERRRQFMRETLGIALDQSVLPLSNMPGWLSPYALVLGKALVNTA